jgi:very-short-patch-repair endonuclease
MFYYSRKRRRYHRRSDSAKFAKALEMRNNPTKAEATMWDIIRAQAYPNFPDYIFYRQSVQYGYILDFYCPRLKMGIEVDGEVHNEQEQARYDYDRDNQLAREGIEILRFTNVEVLHYPQETGSKIYQTLKDKYEHPPKGYTPREGCFIATAAFNTPMAQEIGVLRSFRDSRMEPNLIGRYLILLYYNVSPPLARLVAQSNRMKAFVRLSLKPMIRLFETSNNT